jgi:hypothetical protein
LQRKLWGGVNYQSEQDERILTGDSDATLGVGEPRRNELDAADDGVGD